MKIYVFLDFSHLKSFKIGAKLCNILDLLIYSIILFLIQTKLCHVIVLKAPHADPEYWNPMLRRIALPFQGDNAHEGA